MALHSYIEPEDPQWRAIIDEAPQDFYYLPEYCCLDAMLSGASAKAFFARDDDNYFLAPLLIRELPQNLHAPGGWRDAISPYGYSGPLLKDATDMEFLERSLQALHKTSREIGLVSAFFRLHPLFPVANASLSKFGNVMTVGKTVYIDLSFSKDELSSQMRECHRRNIRKLRNSKFQVTVDNWDFYNQFIEMYWANMKRVGAAKQYMFNQNYFNTLKRILGDHIHLFSVLAPNGQVAAAGLFVETKGLVQYHLGATAEEYIKLAPMKLLISQVIDWAKDSGHHVLHLGGGVGGRQDSLYNFKKGFSALSDDFQTFKIIFDEDKYSFLSKKAANISGGDIKHATDFFPIYRSLP